MCKKSLNQDSKEGCIGWNCQYWAIPKEGRRSFSSNIVFKILLQFLINVIKCRSYICLMRKSLSSIFLFLYGLGSFSQMCTITGTKPFSLFDVNIFELICDFYRKGKKSKYVVFIILLQSFYTFFYLLVHTL